MSETDPDDLLGKWRTDPQDIQSEAEYGKVSLEFTDDGEMIYTIYGDDQNGIMRLTYYVENGLLVTDQPSSPKKEYTPFAITPEGKLVLIYGEQVSRYVRIE